VRHGIHFISSLPRAGSTLLADILRRNPRCHAMMTSPVSGIYMAMQMAVSRKNEAAVFTNEAQMRPLLRGVFENYDAPIGAERLVFDTSRIWCTKLPSLADHLPAAKVICCVRDIAWIMDSIERLIRRNPHELSGLFAFEAGGIVYTRSNWLEQKDGLVGFALDALRVACFGEHADRLLLVEYEALTREPARTLAAIYYFVGAASVTHDFNNVEYAAHESDLSIGAPGLHTVARRVAFTPRPSILPPELFHRFEGDTFWRDPAAIPHLQVV